MGKEFYIPLIAFDSEKEARRILIELAFETTGLIVKLNEKEWNNLCKKRLIK